MTDAPADVDAMFADLVRQYGGIDKLSTADAAILKALAVALVSEPIVPATIAGLRGLLPAQSSGPRAIDLSLCSDAELDQLEAIVDRAAVPGAPVPPGIEHVRELLDMNSTLRRSHDEKDEQLRIERQARELHKHMSAESLAEIRRLRDENADLRKQLAATPASAAADNATAGSAVAARADPAPAEPPPNVVPIRSAPCALAFDPIIRCAPPHLDARKANWPEY
jgi:hypothetical protein